MKKIIVVALALAIMSCGWALAVGNPLLGKTMPDFTVTTCEGDEVSLGALLGEKDLVLVNIFTSWCPSCRVEFPVMQEVLSEYADRMQIVAVSDYSEDSAEVLADYKAELGLTFPMGNAAGTGVVEFADIVGYPTTLFVDKSGRVVFYGDMPFVYPSQFRAVVDHFLADDWDGQPAAPFNVIVCDEDGQPVPGVSVSLCSDEVCIPLVSSEEGMILYVGAPDDYHLQLLKAPEGYSLIEGFEPEPISDVWWLVVVRRDS